MSNEKVAYVQKQTVITVDQVATLRGISDKEKSMKTNDKETTFHAYLSQQLEEPHFREEYDGLQAAEAVAQAVIESGRSEEEIRFRSEMLAAMMRSDIYAYERMVRKLSNREIVNRLIAVIVPGAGGVTGSL